SSSLGKSWRCRVEGRTGDGQDGASDLALAARAEGRGAGGLSASPRSLPTADGTAARLSAAGAERLLRGRSVGAIVGPRHGGPWTPPDRRRLLYREADPG